MKAYWYRFQLKNKGGHASAAFIFVTLLIDTLGMGLLMPVLPFYALHFGGDALTVGLLTTIYAGAQFIGAPIFGALSDRWGRRRVLLLSVLATGVDYLLTGIAWTLPVLFVARTISGFTGGNMTTAQAYIADTTPAEKRSQQFARMGAAMSAGLILGPALGGLLSRISFVLPPFAAAALALANLAYGYFVLPESLPPDRRATDPVTLALFNPLARLKNLWDRSNLRVLLFVGFLVQFAFVSLTSNFPVFSEARFNFGPGELGSFFFVVGGLSVLFQSLLYRPLVLRLGERTTAISGLALMSVAFALMAVAPSALSIYLVNGVFILGLSMSNPSLQGILSGLVQPHEQGQVLGGIAGLNSLAGILGPMWAGFLATRLALGAPYWSNAFTIASALLFFIMTAPLPRRLSLVLRK